MVSVGICEQGGRLGGRDRVVHDLWRQVRSGQLRVGDQIPTGRELARRYGVSQSTVCKALGILKAEGVLVGHPGVAVVVATVPSHDKPGVGVIALADIAREVADLSRRVSDLERRDQ
jgi:DNA-binding GntR family transcriptional regulator